MRGRLTAKITMQKLKHWHHMMIKPEIVKASLIKKEIESILNSEYDARSASYYKLFHLRYTLLLNQFDKSQQILHQCIANRKQMASSTYHFYFLFFRGIYYYKLKKDYAGAIRYFKEAESYIPFIQSLTAIEKADFYYHYGLSLGRSYKIDRSIYAGKLALTTFKKANYFESAAKCEIILGINYGRKGKAAVSEFHYHQALMYLSYTSNYQLRHTAYHNLGHLYSVEGKYRKAIHFYKKSLQLIGKGEYLARAQTSCDITRVLVKNGNYQEALKWCEAGLQYAERHKLVDYIYHFQILYQQLTDGCDIVLYKLLENEAIPFFKMKNEYRFVEEYTELMIECYKKTKGS
ncbi:tetratricopeptide repeat protein [Scopulibacillus cellulosilyticus]|uniref:Tetratricopeptide repeat protein n=1 Tax=Scopulibacillus cellulosilyticus TaxID=2665665 RepID=A0ABW2PR51_9BACL